MSYDHIQPYYDEVSRCSRCGFCQATCPTYQLDNLETDVARGRNTLVRALIEGRTRLDAQAAHMLDACLRCGACVSNCLAGVRTDLVMAAARAEIVDKRGRGPLAWALISVLYPNRFLLNLAMRTAAWLKWLGLGRLAALGVWAGAWGKGLARAQRVVGRMTTSFFSDRLKPGSVLAPYGEKKMTVAYFVGCRTEYLYPFQGEATVEVLRRWGAEVRLLDSPPTCCGLPAHSYGYAKAARGMARTLARSLDAVACDLIVTETGSCYHYLKEIKTLYGSDGEFGPAAKRVADKVAYLSDFLENPGSLPADKPLGRYPRRVVFQDSCQLKHLQKGTADPRRLLKRLEGLELLEAAEADWCCGGAGAYTLTHPVQSEAVLKRKLEHIRATGAEEVVVGCQSCYLQLDWGLRARGLPLKVKHFVEVLEEATRPPLA